jgi:hypothetical protein
LQCKSSHKYAFNSAIDRTVVYQSGILEWLHTWIAEHLHAEIATEVLSHGVHPHRSERRMMHSETSQQIQGTLQVDLGPRRLRHQRRATPMLSLMAGRSLQALHA